MSSTSKPVLKIDWATHEAAKFACLNWHYSKCLPMPPMVRVGVWENGNFIGVVLFSRGASPGLGSKYGLLQDEVCELSRVAMTTHITQVSRIIRFAVSFLRKSNPGIRLLVSFADPDEEHHGGIYQAGGWIYTGTSGSELKFFHAGRWKHRREVVSKVCFGKSKKQIDYKSLPQKLTSGKYRYLMPLDNDMRKQIEPLSKPYPKRAKKQDSENPSELGGAVPTDTLHNIKAA